MNIRRMKRITKGLRVLNNPETRKLVGISDDLARWLYNQLLGASLEALDEKCPDR